ncbi:MAG: hypothetical protein ACLTYW_02900 [Collinsella sp.]
MPVRVKGKTVDRKKVDKVDISLHGSGIAYPGRTPQAGEPSPPMAPSTRCLARRPNHARQRFCRGQKIDLAELAEQDSVLDFTPIDAADVTDDEINDAVTLAMAYKGETPTSMHCNTPQRTAATPPSRQRKPPKRKRRVGPRLAQSRRTPSRPKPSVSTCPVLGWQGDGGSRQRHDAVRQSSAVELSSRSSVH